MTRENGPNLIAIRSRTRAGIHAVEDFVRQGRVRRVCSPVRTRCRLWEKRDFNRETHAGRNGSERLTDVQIDPACSSMLFRGISRLL